MADFNVKSDAVDVDEIMKQIRTRIREKRGVDYTEADLQHLANIKMEQFLDPRKLRSDLVEQFKRQRAASPAPSSPDAAPQVETGGPLKRMVRKAVKRVVRTAVNPQDTIDTMNAEFRRREERYSEILHNLVIELTRLGIEVHNLRMHVESLSSRLDFDERRGRALESVVQYKSAPLAGIQASAPPPPLPTVSNSPGPTSGSTIASSGQPGSTSQGAPAGTPGGRPDGQRRRRRRRRRHGQSGQGGPGGPGAPGAGGGSPGGQGQTSSGQSAAPETSGSADGDAGDFDDDGSDGDGAPDQ